MTSTAGKVRDLVKTWLASLKEAGDGARAGSGLAGSPVESARTAVARAAALGARTGADAVAGLTARLRGPPGDPVLDEIQHDLLILVTEFDALDPARRDDVARATLMLWNAFVDRFTGLDGFLAASEADRAAYVDGLDQAWRRMWPARRTPKGQYVYAAALVARYLAHWRDGGSGTSLTHELGRRVVALIDRGRALPPLGSGEPGEAPAATPGRAAG